MFNTEKRFKSVIAIKNCMRDSAVIQQTEIKELENVMKIATQR